MRLKEKVIVIVALLITVLGCFGLSSDYASAAEYKCPAGTVRGKDAKVSSYAECNFEEVDEDQQVLPVGNRIINFGAGLVGFISVVIVIIGAIFIATSTGDPSKVKRGQMAIIYGLVGVVVSFLAFAIVNFVITNVFKSS